MTNTDVVAEVVEFIEGQPETSYTIVKLNQRTPLQIFSPRLIPPDDLFHEPVHSPSDHTFLNDIAFPKELQVSVPVQSLDMDPGLVGNENGLSGVIMARFFRHVTGSPMLQVDFGGAIGSQPIRVSDATLEMGTTFEETQRMLFLNTHDTTTESRGAWPSSEVKEESGDDLDWLVEYKDCKAF